MPPKSMEIMQQWAGPQEIDSNTANIPTERFDLKVFVNRLKDVVEKIIEERYQVAQDDTPI